MIGFGQTMESLEAQIQARVAEFLACKQKLLVMSRSPYASIRDDATGMLGAQKALEEDLSQSLSIIEKMKKGEYSMSDAFFVAQFAVMMERHIREVKSLEQEFSQAGGVMYEPGLEIPDWAWIVGAGAAAYFILR